jgi:DNA-binding MarR family transcriptional regulator
MGTGLGGRWPLYRYRCSFIGLVYQAEAMTPKTSPRIGYNGALILSALRAGARYGLEVIDRTGLSPGTVYPALRRLEAAGRVAASWEETEYAHQERRPARRYYRITPAGEAALAESRRQIAAQQQALGWADHTDG